MRRKPYRDRPSFDPVLSKGIIAILLVLFALITVLGFFGKAGTVGVILDEWILSFLFGHIRYATPAVLLFLAWSLVKERDYTYRPTHGIGAVLFFLTLSIALHIGFTPEEMWPQALEGNGGGVFGMAAWPLKVYLGMLGSIILLVGLGLISLILLFNTSILSFLTLHTRILRSLGRVGIALTSAFEQTRMKLQTDEGSGESERDMYEDEDIEEESGPRFASRHLHTDTEEKNGEAETVQEGETTSDEDLEMIDEKEISGRRIVVPASPRNTGHAEAEPEWLRNRVIRPLPSLSLLNTKKEKPTSGDIEANAEIIQDTLKEFTIDVDMGEVRVGPTVTQYSLKPAKGVKLSRITALANDLALALAAHPIRIEAPIPGKSLVGIEVPNQKTAMVTLRELFESDTFRQAPHRMMIGLGKDVAGKIWIADLPQMPHLLIAGATGSGKTVCVNTILMSLLFQNTAETLRFIMVDPKRVELTAYNGIPHLLTPVITNVGQTINALKWTISEMERRFEALSRAGARDINSYNQKNNRTKLPSIVFVIDELADLMATAGNEVEAGIIRLAQMARAVGIHLVLATQRPSVDVITGLMKANIPTRIAFSVASIVDSRTILDAPGAEKLLGRGDMLFSTAALSKPVRIQGAFVSEEELQRVVDHLKGGETPVYETSILEKEKGGTLSLFGGPSDDQDPLFDEAKQAILEAGKASASFLQRRLKVGYARAARLLDELEHAGIIGPGEGAKPREILVTETETSGSMNMGQELNAYDDDGEGLPVNEDMETEENNTEDENKY